MSNAIVNCTATAAAAASMACTTCYRRPRCCALPCCGFAGNAGALSCNNSHRHPRCNESLSDFNEMQRWTKKCLVPFLCPTLHFQYWPQLRSAPASWQSMHEMAPWCREGRSSPLWSQWQQVNRRHMNFVLRVQRFVFVATSESRNHLQGISALLLKSEVKPVKLYG